MGYLPVIGTIPVNPGVFSCRDFRVGIFIASAGRLVSAGGGMFRRVPQPPLNAALRDREHHDFWGGFVVGLVGLVLIFAGARHLTGVETTDGGTASEVQLMKAYSCSGLQFPEQVPPPRPPTGNDYAALDRWMKQNAHATPPAWKVRVDLAAKTACPT